MLGGRGMIFLDYEELRKLNKAELIAEIIYLKKTYLKEKEGENERRTR